MAQQVQKEEAITKNLITVVGPESLGEGIAGQEDKGSFFARQFRWYGRFEYTTDTGADSAASTGDILQSLLEDSGRGLGLFAAPAGGRVPFVAQVPDSSPEGWIKELGSFVPDEYWHRFTGNSPTTSAPYARHDKLDRDGNLIQVTIYDRYGCRVRQYELGANVRHGEGYHTFTYSAKHSRHSDGGGIRSSHLPLN